MDNQAVTQLQRSVNQRRLSVASQQILVRQRRARAAFAKPQLIEPRSFAHAHRKAARRNLDPKRAGVTRRRLVESGAAVDDKAGENIEPAGRALRVGGARQRLRQLEPFGERRNIDDAFFQHRALAYERNALGRQAFEPLAHGRGATGQEACAEAERLLPKPEVKARRLDLRGLDDALGADRAGADERGDGGAR